MSRSRTSAGIRKDLVYASDEVMQLCKITANTLSGWKAQGLRAVEGTRPNLFRGQELIRFQADRAARGKTSRRLRLGEFRCFSCQTPVLVMPETLFIKRTVKGCIMGSASCSECGAAVMKMLGESECDILLSGKIHLFSLDSSGEGEAQFTAQIGISESSELKWNPVNERIMHAWCLYAGRYNDKTRVAHAADIRRFEHAIGLKDLRDTTPEEAARYRNMLVEGYRTGSRERPLSTSTVRHAASYLKKFFSWLASHAQIARLEGIPAYFELPKELHQAVPGRGEKDYISLEEAARALARLPACTLQQRRDRAIFALAYTGALRKSALISLRLCHIDVGKKSIDHDGRTLRAKNGKSFRIRWFPGTEAFHSVIIDWLAELQRLGAGPKDALFPDINTLISAQTKAGPRTSGAVWEPMKTGQAADAIFRAAGNILGRKIRPHSARDTISRHGYQICRDPESLKAWTLNMGHDSETTTLTNYGKMSEARKNEVIELLEQTGATSGPDEIWKQDITQTIRELVRKMDLRQEDLF